MNIKTMLKESFTVIGKEGSTADGPGLRCRGSGGMDQMGHSRIRIPAERDSDPAFADVISYMQENHLSLAGAVHDFTCPKTGKNHMFFPVSKL